MQKKKVLVIFSEETTKAYLLTLSAKETKKLKTFHNHYINDPEIDEELEDAMLDFFYDDYKFRYTKEEVMKDSPMNTRTGTEVDLVVMCGFLP